MPIKVIIGVFSIMVIQALRLEETVPMIMWLLVNNKPGGEEDLPEEMDNRIQMICPFPLTPH